MHAAIEHRIHSENLSRLVHGDEMYSKELQDVI